MPGIARIGDTIASLASLERRTHREWQWVGRGYRSSTSTTPGKDLIAPFIAGVIA